MANCWNGEKTKFIIYILTILVAASAAFYRLEGRVAMSDERSLENRNAVKLINSRLSNIEAGIARIEGRLGARTSWPSNSTIELQHSPLGGSHE